LDNVLLKRLLQRQKYQNGERMSRLLLTCPGARCPPGGVGEKETEPEIFLVGIQEGEPFPEFLLNWVPLVAEKAGEDVVRLGIKGLLTEIRILAASNLLLDKRVGDAL
jgi:hypothetical protein